MRNVLIVVDMQNDFISGALGSAEAQAILPLVAKKLASFSGDVYFTRDTHGTDYLNTQEGKNLPVAHCIKDSVGWQIADALSEYVKDATVIDKPSFGSVELAATLRAENETLPIDRITMVGICTDICVISNAMLIKAYLPEVPLAVDATCCAGVTPKSHQNALDAMKACQIMIE